MDRRPVALIEQVDAHGAVLTSWPVHGWPCRVGRAFAADVRLDDPYTAEDHVQLLWQDGAAVLSVGETRNGALVGERHLAAGEAVRLAPGAVWRVGHTRLRVRLPDEALPPERALGRHGVQAAVAEAAAHRPLGWQGWVPWVLLTLLWTGWDMWRDQDPGTPGRDYLAGALITAGVLAGWTLLWSLGSKLFQGRLQYAAHLRLALIHGLAWAVVTAALPTLAFVGDWPLLSQVAGWAGAAVLCRLVWAHLCVLQPGHRTGWATAVATMLVVGVGLQGWMSMQASGTPFSEPYAATVLPPAWRLAEPVPLQTLMDDARALRPGLDTRARQDEGDDVSGAEDGDAAMQ